MASAPTLTAAPKPTSAPLPVLAPQDTLHIQGAREHNLKDIHLSLPRNQLVVITGVSGSGKSSLAFDTIYAEGQRRYLETFSAYVRQFVGGMERPDVDKIDGLSPVIAIDQKTTSRNPRSTVGTITEIYDFLRLLYARVADAYSYVSGRKMEKLSDDEILKRIRQQFEGRTVALLAPVVKGRKGHYREDLEKIRKQGYTRARIDGEIVDLEPKMSLDRYKTHDIEVVIDRLVVEDKVLARLTQSVATSMTQGKGVMYVLDITEAHKPKVHGAGPFPVAFSRNLMDPEAGISYDDPQPNSFSFNSPYGACPTCGGLGRVMNLDLQEVVADERASLLKGALAPLEETHMGDFFDALRPLAKALEFKLSTPWRDLPDPIRRVILEGDPELNQRAAMSAVDELPIFLGGKFIGLTHFLKFRYLNSGSEAVRSATERYLREDRCPECDGARLKKESLHFRIDGQNIHQLASMDLRSLDAWLRELDTPEAQRLSERQQIISHDLLKEIRKRLQFLLDVGLDYLNLDRPAKTLSGGEAQRIRLATQIGSQLMGVLYILDEPSIGLHQRDNERLIRSLQALRDLGNTILVVEHDKDMMMASDYVVDIGPGAGVHGGKVVAQGTPEVFLQQPSATSDYLSGRKTIALPDKRRKPEKGKFLRLLGCTGHNLKNVDFDVPLGVFVCVTGVSGSGKSSLVNQTLYPVLHQHSYGFRKPHLPFKQVKGLELLDKVIEIDQRPIGRTPRSNPATYTGLFTFIRELFAEIPESKIRGYLPGRFSFNVKGGRCEECGGAGLKTIEMNFLPDVHVECPVCRGKRYNRETLEVRYKGKSVSDILNMTVEDAVTFLEAHPRIHQRLKALHDVGLGYITIGQSATTLSGGEAQRMKIATELAKRDTGRTIYILDEPTTGLHFQDIDRLLKVLDLLVQKGNTVLVIEHNLDVIKYADWVIDVGPEGGNAGGTILGAGTPEDIAKLPNSHTGRFLKLELAG